MVRIKLQKPMKHTAHSKEFRRQNNTTDDEIYEIVRGKNLIGILKTQIKESRT